MRDVLTVINGILFANSLSKALSQGLPAVLQRHLDLLQQAVQRQLAPGAQEPGEGSSSPLQGQVRAVLLFNLARHSEATRVSLPSHYLACRLPMFAMQRQHGHECSPGIYQASHMTCTIVLPFRGLQDLARAVHALYTQQLVAALPEALEAAMQAASDHACQAAAAACGALLPADVPPAAAGTAAALVTASCKASCAQRLLQEVRPA
jgi:hypothetical protein